MIQQIQKAKQFILQYQPIPNKISFIGIHGSLLHEGCAPSDIDYIFWISCNKNNICDCDNSKEWLSSKFIPQIAKNYKLIHSYECDHLKMIGYSFLYEKEKYSFHFVSFKCIEENNLEMQRLRNKGTLDTMSSLEVSPFRIYRLWIKDVLAIHDSDSVYKKINPYTQEPLMSDIKLAYEMTCASILHVEGAIDTYYQTIALSALKNYLLTLVLYINRQFLGTPKKIKYYLDQCHLFRPLVLICQDILKSSKIDDRDIAIIKSELKNIRQYYKFENNI